MNQLYQQMMGNKPLPGNVQQLKNMMNMFKGAKNPQQLLMNMASQNPQVKQVMDMVQSSGKSAKELFYETAQKQGVDPNQILSMLQ